MRATLVLLVEDEPEYARFLREVLAEAEGSAFEITSLETLEDALAALRSPGGRQFDVILWISGCQTQTGTKRSSRSDGGASHPHHGTERAS